MNTTSKDMYATLIDGGVDSETARQFILNETGDDPLGLTCATVNVTLELTVELGEVELDGLTEGDEGEIIAIAEQYAVNLVSGSNEVWPISSEIVEMYSE